MPELTSKERIQRILRREPVDRIGISESFWGETIAKWRSEGKLPEDVDPSDHFNFDFHDSGWFNMAGNPDAEEEVLEETDETRLVRNADGAVMRWWKNKAGTPDHIDFTVKDRAGWEELVRPHLVNPSLEGESDERPVLHALKRTSHFVLVALTLHLHRNHAPEPIAKENINSVTRWEAELHLDEFQTRFA